MVRVTDQGHKSFCLAARFPLNPKNPTRRLLGNVGVLTLAETRDKAREWLLLISKGVDPKIEDERIKAEAKRRQDTTFGAVAADFLDRHAVNLEKAKEVRAIIEGEFIKRWKNRPIEFECPWISAKRCAPSRVVEWRHRLIMLLPICRTCSIGRSERANMD